jgi:tetratricopeptide (TPR) repeat protein
MTPSVLPSQDPTTPPQPVQPPRYYQVQKTIALAGFFGFCFLAYARHQSAFRHPLPTLPQRVHQVQTPLLETLVAACFLVWLVALTALKNRSLRPVARDSSPQRRRMRLLGIVFALLLLLGLDAPMLMFLFPHGGRPVAIAALLGVGFMALAGPFLRNPAQKTRFSRGEYAGGLRREPLHVNTLVLVAIAFAAGAGIDVAAVLIAKRNFPAHEHLIFTVVSAVTTVLLVAVWFWFQRSGSEEPQPAALEDADGYATREGRRRKLMQALWLCGYAALTIVVVSLPVRPGVRRLLVYAEAAPVAVYGAMLRRLKAHIFRLGHKGEYDKALRMDRFWGGMPLYGGSLRGIILFNAGRYREALAFLKPLAFDAHGRPRYSSVEFYSYVLSLNNDNRPAEAEPLLEAAIDAAPADYLRVSLATCLLTQGKDPQRAVRLMEQAMAGPVFGGLRNENRADHARRIARYAWALSAASRSQEARARIDEALQLAMNLRPEDAAGVQYFVGEAWRAMGENAKARAAFDEAVRLRPTGVTAMSVKKALAKMENRWSAWQTQS